MQGWNSPQSQRGWGDFASFLFFFSLTLRMFCGKILSMKMETQKYLEANGLQALIDEFHIDVSDYEDRVVLNYNQIDSPRFHPICDECRALILRKGTWEVLARSFDRFYNVGEGQDWKDFPVEKAHIYEKLDGSLISVYNDGNGWHPATRKKAFAEGGTAFGLDFKELFEKAIEGKKVNTFLATSSPFFTYIFELTSPMNRVVTPYSETKVTLIGARNNLDGYEFGKELLDSIAKDMDVARPKIYECNTFEEVTRKAEELETMDEGFVLTVEQAGSFRRLKCKNSKYLAIAHMRNNGAVSPRRILTLVIDNEEAEYLSYFPEDKPYFDFVKLAYLDSFNRISDIWDECGKIEEQKEFAIAIQKRVKYSHEAGILFRMRKGTSLYDNIIGMGDTKDTACKKLAKSLNLKSRFAKQFGLQVEED